MPSGKFGAFNPGSHRVRARVRVICSVGFSSGQGRVFRYHSGAAVAAYALFCSQRRHRCWLARSIAIANKSFLGALGFLAEGQGAPGSPAHPAVDPRPPARHSARREQPAGRATGHRGRPSAAGPACLWSPPAEPSPAGVRPVRPPARHTGSSTPPGSPHQSPGPSRSSLAIAIKAPAFMIAAAVLQAPPGSGDGRIPCSRSRCQPSQRQ